MRNIKITIRYDGTHYAGWQFQKNAPSIQEVIQNALKKITGSKVNLIGSGRTDSGVHAMAQVANFRTRSKIPLKNLHMALNSLLPKDIVVFSVEVAAPKFHSQHDARSKLYRYMIVNDDFVDPFIRNFAAKCFFKLDINAMKKGAKHLVGRHDFRSFRTVDGEEKDTVRRIMRIDIEKSGNIVYIYLKADGFLYNMARSIVGTLVEVGRKKIKESDIKNILSKKDRRHSGPTMPAKGLCLVKVDYGNE